MPTFEEFLMSMYFGNTGQEILIAAAIFIGLFIVLQLVDKSIVIWLKQKAKKTTNQYDDIIIGVIASIRWQFFAYLSLYIGSRSLVLPELADRILFVLLLLFIAYYAAKALGSIVDHFTEQQLEKRREKGEPENRSMTKAFGILIKIAIYSVALLMILSNVGIEVTPLIASLGVGGIAIAIALQGVLTDLFAAFSIYFDKPFQEGDFIIIGSDMGVVKNVGIKTTRIQSLQGQELIVSNSELTSTRINNYKRMQRRRIVFKFGVEYDTPLEKLKKINEIVTKIVGSVKEATLDRVHFHEYGDFSLNYEVVYYCETPDYNKYMDIQQEINFKLKEAFEKEKIVFAFPTQTIFVEGLKKK